MTEDEMVGYIPYFALCFSIRCYQKNPDELFGKPNISSVWLFLSCILYDKLVIVSKALPEYYESSWKIIRPKLGVVGTLASEAGGGAVL